MSRNQIKAIMADRKSESAGSAPATAKPAVAAAPTVGARPVLPPEVTQVFAPLRGAAPAGAGVVFQPRVLGVCSVRFTDKKAKIDTARDCIFAAPISDDAVPVSWDNAEEVTIDSSDFSKDGASGDFAAIAPAAGQVKNYSKWSKDLAAWLYGAQRLTIYRSEVTDETSAADEDERSFRIRIQQRAHELRDEAVDALRTKYASKIATQQDRVRRAEAAKEREESQARTSKIGSILSGVAAALGIFTSKKTMTAGNIGKASSAMKGIGRTVQQSEDVTRALGNVQAEQQKLDELNAQLQEEINALTNQYDVANEKFAAVELKPTKTNINVKFVSLAWFPYFRDEIGVLTPAF
jgi:hypothetical protein